MAHMSTYRTGNHWGVTIVATADAPWPVGMEHPDDRLVAVVVNGDRELADRICALLNGDEPGMVETTTLADLAAGRRTYVPGPRPSGRHGPETAPASTESAQEPSAGGTGGAEASEAISGTPIPDSGIGASIVFLDDREGA
jgi:hypothetical protein